MGPGSFSDNFFVMPPLYTEGRMEDSDGETAICELLHQRTGREFPDQFYL